MFFPGQALLSDGRCIRFIGIPFTESVVEVPYWYVRIFVVVFLGLALLTLLSLLLAWKHRHSRGADKV